ncbi:MAG: tetratricopeptide repeat protein [Bacteroides sp.]|nr:tetratricopeptide repeat protein [Prevotella sp.]MCM1408547.1 tetratricopeptide repeat protein [Treponema brennaborense]MCM1470739.1 tetratricopeptide repeat protein [Bacteroides sp.]
MSDTINTTISRAKSAVIAHDFETASRLFRSVLKKDPNNIDVLLQLGDVYVRAGQDNKALQTYKTINTIDPQNFEAFDSLGGIYRRLGKYEESIAVLERALTLGKNAAAVYYNLGHTYKLMGNYDDAEECFNTVIEENPGDVLAFNHLGAIQALRGNHEKALQTYSRALQLDPNHPVLHYNMALSCEALEKYTDAKAAYENALKSRPGWTEVMEKYAALLLKLKKTNSALRVYRDAIQLDPENTDFQLAAASIYMKQRRMPEAETCYKRVLNRDKNNTASRVGLAKIYSRRKKYAEAADLLKKNAESPDADSSIRLLYADALLHTGETEKVRRLLDDMQKTQPAVPDMWNLRSRLYIKTGADAAAEDCLRYIAKLFPSYISHFKDCGEFCSELGKYLKARDYMRQYLRRRDDDSEAFQLMGSIFEAMRDFEHARSMYNQALSLDKDNAQLAEDADRMEKRIASIKAKAEKTLPTDDAAPDFDADSLPPEENAANPAEAASALSAFIEETPIDDGTGTSDADSADMKAAESGADDLSRNLFEELAKLAAAAGLKDDESSESPFLEEDEDDIAALFDDEATSIEDIAEKDDPLDFIPDEPFEEMTVDADPPEDEEQEFVNVSDPESGYDYDYEDEQLPIDSEPEEMPEAEPEPEEFFPSEAEESEEIPLTEAAEAEADPQTAEEPETDFEPEAETENLPAEEEYAENPPETEELPELPDDAADVQESAEPMPCGEIAAMLKELRQLCANLPPEKKERFFSGSEYRRLENLIRTLDANLAKKDGLYAAAEKMLFGSEDYSERKAEQFPEAALGTERRHLVDAKEVRRLLEYLRSLTAYLPDSAAASAIAEKIDALLNSGEQLEIIFG